MAITTTGNLTGVFKALFDARIAHAFEANAVFMASMTVKKAETGAERGSTTRFTVYNAMSATTAELSETGDGTAVTIAKSAYIATLKEYGNRVQISNKLKATHFGDMHRVAADKIALNAVSSLDTLARVPYDSQTGATWNTYPGTHTAITTITIGDVITAAKMRDMSASLAARDVPRFDDGFYHMYMHPHVWNDVEDETTAVGSWTATSQYTGSLAGQVFNGEVGTFAGFRIITSTRCKIAVKGGDGTTTSATSADIYTTYAAGQEAIGFAETPEFNTPKIAVYFAEVSDSDPYGRKAGASWYALADWIALRPDSLQKFRGASALGGGA